MTSWKRVSSSAYGSPAATFRSCAAKISASSTSCGWVMRSAASAAIAGSISPRNSITSASECPRDMRLVSGRARSSGDVCRTNVPPPARVSTMPRSSSVRRASRTEARDTWNCSASCRSGGSWSPGRRSPFSRSPSICWTIPWYRRLRRIGSMTVRGVPPHESLWSGGQTRCPAERTAVGGRRQLSVPD